VIHRAHAFGVERLEAERAVAAAKARNRSPVIVDTAGRLHTRVNLMNELDKIRRVAAREVPGAPHEVLLVLDATTGQNAISQVDAFKNTVPLTGLVMTKLDGTAKGGILVALAAKFALPIHFIGEIARPISLSLRLFGNVTGEDVLLFAFCSLGVTTLSALHSPVGIPFQVPFILLAFLTSFIQALVFTLLSTIYILLWLPHEEHAEGHH
jgi:hypothetical protein